jgi:4-amino-4-deoxy-L-arabinose transferase-like glycosyltransferase
MVMINPSKRFSDLGRDSLLIFFSGIVIFTAARNRGFISSETRFALFAQEMLRNGPSFFPTTYGTPYPDYPATSTFIIYLISLPFGNVTPFTATLPTAIVSALVLVITYRIGATQSRKWGWSAVLFALSTYLFFSESRSISLDQYNSLATALCFYLAYSATICGRGKRLWFIPLILVASFSFRGLVGLIIPAGVVCTYYVCRREFKKLLLMGILTLGLLSVCSAAMLVAAYLQGGETFVRRVVDAQAAGRMVESRVSHFYYWYGGLSSCAVSYPLAVLVVIAGSRHILRREDRDYEFIGYMVGWVLIVLIAMSVPAAKKMRYILPIVPALSLVAAYLLVDSSPKEILFATRKTFLAICTFLPLFASIATVGILSVGKYFGLAVDVHFLIALALLIGLTIIAGTLNKRLRGYPNQDMASVVVGVTAFIIVSIGVVQPINATLECTRPFVEKVKLLQKEQPGDLIFYQIGPDAEDIKFMVNYDKPIMPIFIKSPDELLKCRKNSCFIAKKQSFDHLPEDMKKRIQLRFEGRIGHRDCVVFTLHESSENIGVQTNFPVETIGLASTW